MSTESAALTRAKDPEAQRVLDYWFGLPAVDAEVLRAKMRRWYMGGESVDHEIRTQFEPLVERALRGELRTWEQDPQTRLALIVLLDQFTRSIYRNDPRTYAGDRDAQRLATDAVDRGWDRLLSLEERQFLNMPFLHAESLPLQERGVEAMTRLTADAPATLRDVFAMGLDQAKKYRGVIARYGRFPHRNEILGRTSTPEEIEMLRTWAERQPPRAMKG